MSDHDSTPTDLDASAILDGVNDGVFTVDRQWRITSFNRAAEAITGVPRADAIGQKCWDVLRAGVCDGACVLRRTMETGQNAVDQRINILNRAGTEVPISISTAVLRNNAGEVIGGVETIRDLSGFQPLQEPQSFNETCPDIISRNPAIQRMIALMPDIAESGSTVLIEGATGTGKEVFARAIHRLSRRSAGPFVAVNCGALPDTLLESELFGYVRGAFTDARKDKPGRFALAEGGTIFLDEVGDTSPALQVKLLRVLEEHVYEPVGGTASQRSNARVLAATNRGLLQMVHEGHFREDLYYRLNVVKLTLPPLAERREDIPLLVSHFVRTRNMEKGREVPGVAPDALELLTQYPFPGNVRELDNIIEHAFILCKDGPIQYQHLPEELRQWHLHKPSERHFEEGGTLQRGEVAEIVSALQRCGGNRSQTAALLGIHKTTLWRKMKRYNISERPPYLPRQHG
jgi:PAS domain S-box-containing protein